MHPAAELPRVLGRRYVLEKVLGQGGMGTVYQALDRLTQQPVALKCLPTQPLDATLQQQALLPTSGESTAREGRESTAHARNAVTDEDSAALALRLRVALAHEFSVLSGLHHPNIIRVRDYGFDAQLEPFFTMELMPAPQTVTQAAAGLSLAGKIELLTQLLRALIYLHRHGILHREVSR